MSADFDYPWPKSTMTLAEISDSQSVSVLRTDALVAQQLRDELSPHLDAVCDVMAKAKAAGLGLSWNIQPDSFGRTFRVVEISIVKPL